MHTPLHDGYTDLIYLLLPIWQAEYGLSYSALALLRGLAAATMAGVQLPAGRMAEHVGGRTTLVIGTALAAIGYVVAGYSTGLVGLCVALVAIGCGLSTQHPIGSAAVSRLSRQRARSPWHLQFRRRFGQSRNLAASLLLGLMSWHQMLGVLSVSRQHRRSGRGGLPY